MDLQNALTLLLVDAQEILNVLPCSEKTCNFRLIWLERQLSHLVNQLQSLQVDIDAGCSLSDLGYFGEEGEERIGDLTLEISGLKGLIQTARMIER